MTSALVATTDSAGAPGWTDDLTKVGVHVLGVTDTAALIQTAIRSEPDLVVCFENHPDDDFFSSTTTLNRSAPRPVIVFTTNADADNIDRAARSGVHSYVINGYGLHRLRSVIQVAQARFRYEQLLREELTDVNQRFAERKLVDRAKGILMGARQIREDDAFRALRSAAMNTKQRIGQVAQKIIDSARFAEAVNRAGQLRMLSQRLVKVYVLICAGVRPEDHAGTLADSIEHVDRNLAILGKTISASTFGDLLARALSSWKELKACLGQPNAVGRLPAIDALAETFLDEAERLTANLEIAGLATNLRVINVSGRQRMLSQRLAKQALLATMGQGDENARASLAATEREFVEGLAILRATPLVTIEITKGLGDAEAHWTAYRPCLHASDTEGGRQDIAEISEIILTDFDTLTDAYERALQALFT